MQQADRDPPDLGQEVHVLLDGPVVVIEMTAADEMVEAIRRETLGEQGFESWPWENDRVVKFTPGEAKAIKKVEHWMQSSTSEGLWEPMDFRTLGTTRLTREDVENLITARGKIYKAAQRLVESGLKQAKRKLAKDPSNRGLQTTIKDLETAWAGQFYALTYKDGKRASRALLGFFTPMEVYHLYTTKSRRVPFREGLRGKHEWMFSFLENYRSHRDGLMRVLAPKKQSWWSRVRG